jgi:hypothetical protein
MVTDEDVNQLKLCLKFRNIDYSKYTDEELKSLIELIIAWIEAETGLPILEPRVINVFVPDYCKKSYVTDFYPIKDVTLDESLIKHIDLRQGIIHFKKRFHGDLEFNYNIQYKSDLKGLICDIAISYIEGNIHGRISNIREGDVSVSYDNASLDLQERIDTKIRELKGYFKPRMRML